MTELIKPFSSYAQLEARYGDPHDPSFEDKWIVSYPHVLGNGKTIYIRANRDVTIPIHNVFEGLVRNGGIKYLVEYDGAFNVRPIRDSSNLSMHAYGLALDFNASTETLGSTDRLPDVVVDTFKMYGFFYGGDFIHRKDPMHFEYTTGVI